ncbi:MAG: tRNA uridine-5-carboxymethylaminomethyl(34) synthesis enzyme MnmG [Phycisphaerales bacterium]|nr:tRNA uridine-5-carboxymethylaminomethyl(34) synthesis enzyme MnmG [Phycisphaerales bacterium]
MSVAHLDVIIIGGGHAGVEAAWAAANLIPRAHAVALVTLDPAKIGVMSCNPAIGGLAKGQIVREIDALGGLMGLATDATGIQFKVLNTSKGPAVHGPRAQCDKHAYAQEVQRLIASRPEIKIIAGSVERLIVERGAIRGVEIADPAGASVLLAPAVVLTTGTFMRGLMHTGEQKTSGGRFGEAPAVGISGALRELGFELGRLKTGTPPRLKKSTIDWDNLPPAPGDKIPTPFSDLAEIAPSLRRFPVLEQIDCRSTSTNQAAHDAIRANLHRAPMYSGQIESVGPRYCPSIEDKVVRFADRSSHGVFLEPESLIPEHSEWIYCNGVSTSLPADVQDQIVHAMPGCERAEILRYGYAVEYDMVRPHQIHATGETKLIRGLFLAGQINGTSGYEEAAAQGWIAGVNAARRAREQDPITLGRDQAYIGVLMDDLVTKTPVEPYRMFTSRAEHRLLLRSDNAPERLTPLARELGLLDSTELGRLRARVFGARTTFIARLGDEVDRIRIPIDGHPTPLRELIRRPDYAFEQFQIDAAPAIAWARAGLTELTDRAARSAMFTLHTERFYEPFIARQRIEIGRAIEMERKTIPADFDYHPHNALRAEARAALARFRPATMGQAGRLEGVTPADLTLLSVLIHRHRRGPQPAAAS